MGIGGGMPIIQAEQLIRFKLDEKGAMLRSEAGFGIFGSLPKLIFNRPFLLMLKRRDAKMPYFAAWIDNAELLVPESVERLALLKELRFDAVRHFSDGLAAVCVGEKWGFIDGTGKLVVPASFDVVGDFHDGLAPATMTVAPITPAKTRTREKETRRIIEKDGAGIVLDDYVPARTPGSAPKWGFIDKAGRWAVSPRFSYARAFCEGRAAVCVGGEPLSLGDLDALEHADGLDMRRTLDDLGGKWGYIETSGKLVIDAKYEQAETFENGLAIVARQRARETFFPEEKVEGAVLFIDRAGKPLGGRAFNDVKPFHEGFAEVHVDGKGWGFIDRTGKLMIPPRFKRVLGPFRDGVAIVVLDGNVGFVDAKGGFRAFEVQKPEIFDTEHSDGRLRFSVSGPDVDGETYGFMGLDGRIAIAPTFAQAENFSEGRAAVYVRDKGWGYIEASGKMVIAPRFSRAGLFDDGLAAVCTQKDRYGFIDRTGKWVIKPEFEHVEPFREGLAGVMLDGKFGFVDRTGKFAIENRFGEIGSFHNGFAPVAIRVGTDEAFDEPEYGWSFVDKTGRVLADIASD